MLGILGGQMARLSWAVGHAMPRSEVCEAWVVGRREHSLLTDPTRVGTRRRRLRGGDFLALTPHHSHAPQPRSTTCAPRLFGLRSWALRVPRCRPRRGVGDSTPTRARPSPSVRHSPRCGSGHELIVTIWGRSASRGDVSQTGEGFRAAGGVGWVECVCAVCVGGGLSKYVRASRSDS